VSAIELRGVTKGYADTPVLADLELAVPDGSITAVLGASGSGKSTLLRLVAGFDRVDTGTVAIGGRVVDDGSRFVRPQHRSVGYVPQDGALFPHLTVVGNVGFGVPRRERARVGRLIDLVGLGGLERRYPHQLSGGQQQRAALARALAIRPRVVLLDEPFSALDASLRDSLRRDVARILAETGTTTILVTHDQDEALALADQVAVLCGGRVIASADPRTLYAHPPDLGAATAIGESNILAADIHTGRAHCMLGSVDLHAAPGNGTGGAGRARLLLRPEQLVLHLAQQRRAVAATVVDAQYHGHDALVRIAVGGSDGQTLFARTPGDLALVPGQRIWVEVRGPGRAWPADEPNAGLNGRGGRSAAGPPGGAAPDLPPTVGASSAPSGRSAGPAGPAGPPSPSPARRPAPDAERPPRAHP
jgi:iron(III) transport system ATP-binding protein